MKTSFKHIGIIGYGEIGQALDAIYIEEGYMPLIRDLDRDDCLGGVDVLNICIPYGYHFLADVSRYIEEIDPELVIIHSTIPPGTTEKFSHSNIVHSPVRGIHPNLKEGIRTFVKVIGGSGWEDAKAHIESLGIEVEVYEDSTTTEVAKLLDTSYYGVCIAWHDYAKKLCEQFGVDFEEAQTHYNLTYNEGYEDLGQSNVVRPTLTPPKGFIGGHCVVSNAELLRVELDSKLLQAITDLS